MRPSLFLALILTACSGDGEDSGQDANLTAPEVGTDPAGQAQSDTDIAPAIVTESTGASDISYAYRWTSDDGLSWTQTDTLPASTTVRGQVWTVTVSPSAGSLSGPSGTASVEIINTPPTLSGVSFAADLALGEDIPELVGAGRVVKGVDAEARFVRQLEHVQHVISAVAVDVHEHPTIHRPHEGLHLQVASGRIPLGLLQALTVGLGLGEDPALPREVAHTGRR